ncbi:hypothetical protein TeGR_g10464 [Tetraparma gracilis]|uniref:Uncharacterized protein n=1 Tax=Tetraparma gracilis TaxID=2962635 RepID=A0ABQ6MGA5_9STRA|nr:hypothetical protein TeGR_g10464 [Tetraparma gracilis]
MPASPPAPASTPATKPADAFFMTPPPSLSNEAWTVDDSKKWCHDWCMSEETEASDMVVSQFKSISLNSVVDEPSPSAILVLPILEAISDVTPHMSKKWFEGYRSTVKSILTAYKKAFLEIEAMDNKPFAVTNDFIVLTSALAHKITDVTNAEKNRSTASFFEQRSLATEFNKKLNTEFQLIVRIFARIEAADRIAVPQPASDGATDAPPPSATAADDDNLMSSLFDIITCSPTTKSYKIRPAAPGIPAPSAPAAPGASEIAKVLELAAVEGGLETQSVAPSTMGEEVAAAPADKPEPTPAPTLTTPPEPTPAVPLAAAPKKKSRRRSLSKFLKKAFVPADPVPAPAPSKKAVPKAPIAAPIAAPAGVEAPSDAPSIEAKAKEAPSLTTKEAPSLATKEAPSIAAKDTDSTSSEKSVNDDPVADDPVADEAPKTPLATGGGINLETVASC